MGEYITVQESDLEKAVFDKGIMVLPVEYTKGLEFDTVLILDPTREEYPVEDGHAKLLYVAATRALHELHVLHTGNLTGLIADPLPKSPPLDNSGSRNPQEPESGKWRRYEKEDFHSMQSLSRERTGFKSFSGTAGFKVRGKKACGCPSRPPDNRIFHRKKFLRGVRNRKTGHNSCFCEKRFAYVGQQGGGRDPYQS